MPKTGVVICGPNTWAELERIPADLHAGGRRSAKTSSMETVYQAVTGHVQPLVHTTKKLQKSPQPGIQSQFHTARIPKSPQQGNRQVTRGRAIRVSILKTRTSAEHFELVSQGSFGHLPRSSGFRCMNITCVCVLLFSSQSIP